MKIVVVIGTRPECIKLAPIILNLNKQKWVDCTVVCTGQHQEMLNPILDFFEITPTYNLNVMRKSQNLDTLSGRVLVSLGKVIQKINPDIIIVQGDTTTAAMSSYLGFCRKIPVAHVEAGLRTNDRFNPFPEEINRRIAGLTATLHFCPTMRAYNALVSEGVDSNNIYKVGNTVIDALFSASERLIKSPKSINGVDFSRPTILLTMHRRENNGEPMAAVSRAIIKHLRRHPEMQLLYPVHKSPTVRELVYKHFYNITNAILVEPLDYPSFVYSMMNCRFILSDSGGVQEEAPALGKPVVVLRDVTERPEAVESGSAVLAGTNEQKILNYCKTLSTDSLLYKKMATPRQVYGDGKSSQRIISQLKLFLSKNNYV